MHPHHPDLERLRELVERVRANPAEDWDRRALARSAGLGGTKLTELFRLPTISALATHISEVLGASVAEPRPDPDASPKKAHSTSASDEIAIVGMACRLPGGVVTPDEYWELLDAGRDAIGPVPPERWDATALYDPPDKVETDEVTTNILPSEISLRTLYLKAD